MAGIEIRIGDRVTSSRAELGPASGWTRAAMMEMLHRTALRAIDAEFGPLPKMLECGGCHYCEHEYCKDLHARHPAELSAHLLRGRMILCPECGNKRCPRATHHDHECTHSNERGQSGSVYGDYTLDAPWMPGLVIRSARSAPPLDETGSEARDGLGGDAAGRRREVAGGVGLHPQHE